MRGTQSVRRSSRSTANRYKTMTVANDATTKDAANTKQTLLPGCGRPLNYIPKKTDSDYIGKLFKNALSTVDIEGNEVACVFFLSATPSDNDFERRARFWFRMSMTTLREFAMLQFMNSVTDKLDWHTKVGFPASVQSFSWHSVYQ